MLETVLAYIYDTLTRTDEPLTPAKKKKTNTQNKLARTDEPQLSLKKEKRNKQVVRSEIEPCFTKAKRRHFVSCHLLFKFKAYLNVPQSRSLFLES
jgi:hypothetical protein